MPKEYPTDLFEVLSDPFNRDPVVMEDDDGKRFTFEQVLFTNIPDKQGIRRYYCVLKPIGNTKGADGNKAYVFRVVVEEDSPTYLSPKVKASVRRKIKKIHRYMLEHNISSVDADCLRF